MRQPVLVIILAEVLASFIAEGNIHGILVNKIACEGGAAQFITLAGTITSPLYPGAPPTRVSCSWVLQNPYQDTVILSFSKFNLDEDKNCGKKSHECCPHQWLMIKTDIGKAKQRLSQVNNDEVKKESHSTKRRRETVGRDRRRKAGENLIGNKRRTSHDKRHNKDLTTLFSIDRKRQSHPWSVDNTAVEDLRDPQTPQTKQNSNTETNKDLNVHTTVEESKTTGHICGNSAPPPVITKASRVIIKFYSDTVADTSHLDFSLQYQISNNETVCGSDEFTCVNPRLCVPDSWKCNGQAECPDSSDETSCGAGCAGMTDSQHCDGRWHCQEGEDELGCFGCDADEWWCGEGTECYKASRRCDNISDCRNGADEKYCSCFNRTRCGPNSEFCYDSKTQRCDGVLHCPNGQDEIDCGGHCRHMIPCNNGGGCYTSSQRCDGASHCSDGSDEDNCTPELCHPQHGAFLCANRRCIRDAWRCDQFDDCGDVSDEEDCLRNSVIVAAAMGGLVCSLLLVIAVGCTCRLYALRMGIGRAQHHGQRVGRRSTPLAPLSRLEQHLLQREPPPSYSVAVNDPSALLFGGSLSRHWRRQRRRPPAPPEGMLPPLPAPLRTQGAPLSTHTYDAGTGHTSRRASFTGEARGRRTTEEKESEERAKVGAFFPVSPPGPQDPAPPADTEDVPLLSAIADSSEDESMEEREDAPLLDISSPLQETDYDDSASASVNSAAEEAEENSHIESAGHHASSSATSHSNAADADCHTPLAAGGYTQPQENACDNKPTVLEENTSLNSQENNDDEALCLTDDLSPYASYDREDEVSLAGDVMTDTRAAVLALSAVQRHTDGICQVDTELVSH
ncbi:uncharacterized protein LOC121867897 isoform X2 [Homarus americanus]|uniref:uncharacterized protein LOC121867897 isoform X2 n=1 Tax=Homarus americanus TaxID=6706 RepID=UPI001C474386|nr:uncharacterized protein LOC121867897 isoform X2 [Homarus americanus]